MLVQSRLGRVDAHREGVLSIGKLAAGQEGYYLAAVAHGAEDYYLGAGEVPGYWIGTTAAQLGLEGRVGDEAFVALLQGVSPVDGMVLGRANRRVPALDLTFSAPKSVSVAWALTGRDVATEIVSAHRDAVAAAVGYLEREAVFVRRGHNGVERLVGGGLVGAAFRHRSSRSGDPQLHTHVVVANAAQGPDGRWSALDGRHLYAQARTAGFLYQAELRAGLTERLGVEWGPVVKGAAELVGIPAEVCAAFSQRRAEIVADAGADASPAENRLAALRTRQAKQAEPEPGVLFADWAARADELGFGEVEVDAWCRSGSVDAGLHRDPSRASAPPSTGSARVSTRLGDQLTEHHSSFDRRHVLQALAEHAQEGERVEVLEARADEFLASEEVVLLGVGRHELCYSTPGLLRIEAELVKGAVMRADETRMAITNIDATLVDYPSLSAEQVRVVRAVTGPGGVRMVVGAAGSGKTYALAAARDAWTREGFTVIGCALAARAARQLETDSGIPSATLDALLADLDRPDTPNPHAMTVIVVDEAAMIGTRKLRLLLNQAYYYQAKVVLVGDPRQLTEIEAGGAFTELRQHLVVARVDANRRQRDPIERQALAELRHWRVDEAMALLAAHGRITEAPTSMQVREQMVNDWYASRSRREDAVMLARRRVDVHDLNHRARQIRKEHGELGPGMIVRGREYSPGDRIITLRNDRRIGVVNGQRGTVRSVDAESGSMRVHFDGERWVREIPGEYLVAGNVDHGHAMTIHKSQGLTCDRSFVLVDDHTHGEAAYTALTRGRDENHLYITAEEPDVDHHGAIDDETPIDGIRRALATSDAETLALGHLRHAIHDAGFPPDLDRIEHRPPQRAVEVDQGMDIGW